MKTTNYAEVSNIILMSTNIHEFEWLAFGIIIKRSGEICTESTLDKAV